MHVRFSQRGPLLTGILIWRRMRVGHVFVAVEGREAVLQDIVLQERVPVSSGGILRRLLGRPHVASFRGLGLGTETLKALFEFLAGAGVRVLTGVAMAPDVTRLFRWYRSLEFSVDEATARIERRLP